MAKETTPKHKILSQWIKDNITNGTYLPGDKIPSENELSLLFNYSRQTVRQAISNLVGEGILSREQGSGTYVSIRLTTLNHTKTMRIGVITTYLDDYIFPSIIRGVEEVLTANGYTLSLAITHNKTSDEANCLSSMINDGVDGIIIEGTKTALPNMNEELYKKLKLRNIPIVFINGFNEAYADSYVIMDDIKGGELAGDFLYGNGHIKIGGFFKSDDIQGIRRYEGLLKSVIKNNSILKDDGVFWYTTEDFHYLFNTSMDAMILERLQGVTAVVCYNDLVAADLIKLLKRNHISVPEDISIISFDNSFLAKEMVCNLTSVIHPSKKMGKKAASILLDLIHSPRGYQLPFNLETGHTPKGECAVLEPTLKIRSSVKNIAVK